MRRATFKLLGVAFVAFGIIGAFLPILPSTIFFILAAGCFARSSPRLEARIINHPVFGPPVIAWREHGAIPLNGKIYAVGGMAVGLIVFFWLSAPPFWLACVVGLSVFACGLFVVTRPSGPPAKKSVNAAQVKSAPADISPKDP